MAVARSPSPRERGSTRRARPAAAPSLSAPPWRAPRADPARLRQRTAANVSVAAGATIAANATAKGNGGRITLLSQQTTSMDGTISATGGPAGGNGGFVETSGPTLYIGNAAVVDASATSPSGMPGTWLLDPLDLDVVGGEGENNNVTQDFRSAVLSLLPQPVPARPSQPISSIGR